MMHTATPQKSHARSRNTEIYEKYVIVNIAGDRLVKFRSRTCQVRAQNLSRSSLKLVTFEPGTCQVLSWHLSGSILQLVQFEPTLIGHACMHIQSSLVSTKKSGANAQLRWRAFALLRVNTASRRLSSYLIATSRHLIACFMAR